MRLRRRRLQLSQTSRRRHLLVPQSALVPSPLFSPRRYPLLHLPWHPSQSQSHRVPALQRPPQEQLLQVPREPAARSPGGYDSSPISRTIVLSVSTLSPATSVQATSHCASVGSPIGPQRRPSRIPTTSSPSGARSCRAVMQRSGSKTLRFIYATLRARRGRSSTTSDSHRPTRRAGPSRSR